MDRPWTGRGAPAAASWLFGGDGSRRRRGSGTIDFNEFLELLLTKILYTAGDKVQVIGMSATLPNLSDLSNWLKASLYTTSFRPVPLTELIKIDSTLLDTNLKPVGAVRPTIALPNDTDNISWMCLETLVESHSVLVFCPIKSWVESLAETIAGDFYQVSSQHVYTCTVQ